MAMAVQSVFKRCEEAVSPPVDRMSRIDSWVSVPVERGLPTSHFRYSTAHFILTGSPPASTGGYPQAAMGSGCPHHRRRARRSSSGRGRVRLTEVLCGPETSLPEPGLLFTPTIRRERSTSLHPGGIVEYQTCFEVERVDREVFRHLCDEMIADGSRQSLMHCFRNRQSSSPCPADPRSRRAPRSRAFGPVVSHLSRRVRHRPFPIALRTRSVPSPGHERPWARPAEHRGQRSDDGACRNPPRLHSVCRAGSARSPPPVLRPISSHSLLRSS